MMSTAGRGAIEPICLSQDITVVQVKANIGGDASQGDDSMVVALRFADRSVAVRATIRVADRARLASPRCADESLADEGGARQ